MSDSPASRYADRLRKERQHAKEGRELEAGVVLAACAWADALDAGYVMLHVTGQALVNAVEAYEKHVSGD